jgi:hypothetical protein
MLRMLLLPQSESYPKLWILTSCKASSTGSHSFGQNSDGSPDFVHVFCDPPPRPWTKIRSAFAKPSAGTNRVFSPRGPSLSSGEGASPPPGSQLREERKERPLEYGRELRSIVHILKAGAGVNTPCDTGRPTEGASRVCGCLVL